MTISYPLAFPSLVGMNNFKISLVNAVSISQSPYDFSSQIYDYGGQTWEIEGSFPLMRREKAYEIQAFLLKLKGQLGTFLVGDPNATTPRGTWAGSPLIKGASQTGTTLICDGFTAGATVKAGDYFQLGTGTSSRLFQIVTDGTADGAGELTLEFMPSIMTAFADNLAVTSSSAKGCFRMLNNSFPSDINSNSLYSFSFKARSTV